MSYMKELYEDFKAWRRGEVRVAPRGVTGRVYAARAKGTLTMTVTRADGTVETITVPAEAIKV